LQLARIPNLQRLEIASNDFCTLPSDLSGLRNLEEFNLSSNVFSSDSVLVQPGKLFLALSTIPRLKKLNLSRNKFKRFHSEDLPDDNLQLAEEEGGEDYLGILPDHQS
jgi:Leucine-rich repeat (LRR) protein